MNSVFSVYGINIKTDLIIYLCHVSVAGDALKLRNVIVNSWYR